MIILFLLQAVTSFLNVLFSWLPTISTLPSIGGVDIDTNMVNGIYMFNTYSNAVWPIRDVFEGFIFLVGFYTIKMVLRFFMGHRAPGSLH